ncbi:MAG TPA: Ig-like domain-containing protein [Dehalococcoidales bacterium]
MKKKPILQFAISIIMVLDIALVSACTFTAPTPDTTAPTVSSTIPVNAATGVAINSAITAIFSEAMNPLTIISVTFTLKQGDTPVLGIVSYSKVSAIFVPASSLTTSTPYTATITIGVKDLAGNALAEDFIWNFTTGEAPDTTAPMVTGTINDNGAINVPVNTKVGAFFSEAMDPLTVTKTTFTLKQGNKRVPGTVSYSNVSAVFVPASNLAYNTLYTVTITTGVKDLAGNAMAAPYILSWTTGAALDITAPMVTGTIHTNGQTNVPINTKVGVTFSEAMDPLTVTNVAFTLKQGNTSILGTVTYSGVSAVFVPASNLAYNTLYTVMITTGVKDLAGNAMAAPYILSWTTGAAPDITAPMVTGTIHTNGQTNVPINTKVGVTFSEAMDPLTVTNVTFTLKQGNTSILGTVTYSNVSAVFVPASNLAYNTVYTVTITTGVKDLAGNAMAAPYILSWTTGKDPDTTAPTVNSVIPTNLATGVAINSAITAIFSEMLDPLTVTNVTFTLKLGTSPVFGTVHYSGNTATFTPFNSLVANTVYTATITTGIKDLTGNALSNNFTWSFTTGAQIVRIFRSE